MAELSARARAGRALSWAAAVALLPAVAGGQLPSAPGVPGRPDTSAAWVRAEDSATTAYLDTLVARTSLRSRLTTLTSIVESTPPVRAGGRLFFEQREPWQSRPVIMVQDWSEHADSVEAAPAAVVDLNPIGGGTVTLGAWAPSDDARYVAYAVGSDETPWEEIRIRDVRTGADEADTLRRTRQSTIAWTRDSRGFFYEAFDRGSAGTPQRVFYHRVGQPQAADRVILDVPEHPDWLFRTRISGDGQYAVISITAGDAERNRLYFVDLDNGRHPRIAAPIVRLFDAADARYDFIDSDGQLFYIRTTRNAPRAQVVAVDINEPRESKWRPVVRETFDPMLDARRVGDRLVAHFVHDGRSGLRFYSLDGNPRGEVELPGYTAVGAIAGGVGQRDVFFSTSGFLSPPSINRYSLDSRANLVFRATRPDVDLTRYETRQVLYTSRDGTQVPMLVTSRRGLALDGSHPALLEAPAGFGIPALPAWNPEAIVWLEAGGVYAVPGARGGGDYGSAWHDAGARERRQNAYDDLIAAAEFLVREGYTTPARLAVRGLSTGGALAGAVLVTQRPELVAGAALGTGPFDAPRYPLAPMGWRLAPELGADSAAAARVLLAWSPVQAVRAGRRYPPVFVTATPTDDRTPPMHAVALVAALQGARPGAQALLRVTTRPIIGGTSQQRVEAAAERLAFLLAAVGAPAPPP